MYAYGLWIRHEAGDVEFSIRVGIAPTLGLFPGARETVKMDFVGGIYFHPCQ